MKISSAKVLLIDDDPSLSQLIRIHLSRKQGCEVLVCDNAMDGARCAVAELPDVILLDWMMPDVSGIKALAIIKKNPETKNIPIVMLTGKNLIKEVEKAFSLGAEGYITKPVKFPRLVSKLRDILANRSQKSSIDKLKKIFAF